jgi:hypothetical protein
LSSDSNESHARVVFNNSVMKLVSQAISNARIQAINDWLKKFKGQVVIVFREGSDMYLTEEQYAQVQHIVLYLILFLLILILF